MHCLTDGIQWCLRRYDSSLADEAAVDWLTYGSSHTIIITSSNSHSSSGLGVTALTGTGAGRVTLWRYKVVPYLHGGVTCLADASRFTMEENNTCWLSQLGDYF